MAAEAVNPLEGSLKGVGETKEGPRTKGMPERAGGDNDWSRKRRINPSVCRKLQCVVRGVAGRG